MDNNTSAPPKFKKGDRVQVRPMEELRLLGARNYVGLIGYIVTVYESFAPHYIVAFHEETGDERQVLLWEHELNAAPESEK